MFLFFSYEVWAALYSISFVLFFLFCNCFAAHHMVWVGFGDLMGLGMGLDGVGLVTCVVSTQVMGLSKKHSRL